MCSRLGCRLRQIVLIVCVFNIFQIRRLNEFLLRPRMLMVRARYMCLLVSVYSLFRLVRVLDVRAANDFPIEGDVLDNVVVSYESVLYEFLIRG